MSTSSLDNISVEEDVYIFPASFFQESLWFLAQLEPNRAIYNMSSTFRLTGLLNLDVLEQVLNAIVQRHESLRTTFMVLEGQLVQVISPTLFTPLQAVDLRHLPRAEQEAEAQRLATEEAQRPFDLTRGPLLRITVLQLGAEEHMLLLTMHHITSDEWSMGVLYQEFAVLYEAFLHDQPSPLPQLPIQYADFAVWQRQWLQGEALATQLSYWRQQLTGAPALLELPTDHPRPAVQTFRGARHHFMLSEELADALKALSRRKGITLFMTLLAAFNVLLSRYTGQTDIVVGSPSANRNRSGIEGLIGFFVNTLVLRTDLSENPSFEELLKQVREIALEAYAHQDLPFEKLVEELHPERNLSHNPLFQVMFNFVSDLRPTFDLPGLRLRPVEVENETAEFDLSLTLGDTGQGLTGSFEYSTDLFEPATMSRMVGHFQTLLEGIVVNPEQPISELPLLTGAERHQLIVEWNETRSDYPQDLCMHQLFEAQVERTPDAVAVSFEGQQLTYRELNQQANQLAHYLRDLGAGPETLVSLLTERGTPLLIAILAVFKAGGAYLPLDPHHPPARLRRVIEQSASHLVLAAKEFTPALSQVLSDMDSEVRPRVVYFEDLQFLDGRAEDNLPVCITPRNLAYVIYTSGSTGVPKGAMIEHRGMLNHIYAKINGLHLTAADNVAQTASQCFDISVWQMLVALLVGGRVHIFPDAIAHNPAYLLEQVDRHGISILETVPSLLRAMLEVYEEDGASKPLLKKLRWLIPTGEALSANLCRRWLRLYPHVPLLNAYGPTECSDDVTHHPIYQPPAETESYMPIGRALMNTRLYVLNPLMIPVPIGVNGELYVGGVGVGRGYLHDAQRTAQSFIPDPFSIEPGVMLYKTGDLARYLPDGTLEFLGRIDHQVKIRGFRIELGEIEMVLKRHPAVRDVIVVAREDVPGDQRLVAYVVLDKERLVAVSDLQNHLVKHLPAYMIPSAFVLLEALPLNSNGKVDRRALPAPDDTRPGLREAFVAPRTPIEEMVTGIWSQDLGIEQIGIHDDFFTLGGHSLLATQVTSRLRTALQVEVPLRTFFEASTVAQLAEIIPGLQAQRATPQMPALGTFSREAYRVPMSPVSHE